MQLQHSLMHFFGSILTFPNLISTCNNNCVLLSVTHSTGNLKSQINNKINGNIRIIMTCIYVTGCPPTACLNCMTRFPRSSKFYNYRRLLGQSHLDKAANSIIILALFYGYMQKYIYIMKIGHMENNVEHWHLKSYIYI